MTEALQRICLRAKWKKVLKGRPTTKDLKNYLRDIERHQMQSEGKTQVA